MAGYERDNMGGGFETKKPYTPNAFKKVKQITEPEIGEFKGNGTISLPVGPEGNAFTFGVMKAKAILKYIKDIEGFVESADRAYRERTKQG
jgi:hypothetical protein